MVLLQPKLNLRVSQKQILTPGLVQMVSVLALNKIELKDMINAEMMENPVLEELESQVPLLDDIAGREADRERAAAETPQEPVVAKSDDPFEQIDFGQYFQEYLDPGYRSPESEFVEKPSFENFVSKPTSLTEHLMWQLGAMHVSPPVYRAAELIIGNLNEDGYLTASDEELMAAARGEQMAEIMKPAPAAGVGEASIAGGKEAAEIEASWLGADDLRAEIAAPGPVLGCIATESDSEIPVAGRPAESAGIFAVPPAGISGLSISAAAAPATAPRAAMAVVATVAEAEVIAPEISEDAAPVESAPLQPAFTARNNGLALVRPSAQPADAAPGESAAGAVRRAAFDVEDLREAIELVRQMDPIGVAARDLRECLLLQLEQLSAAHLGIRTNGHGTRNGLDAENGEASSADPARVSDAIRIVDAHLCQVQNKQFKEIARAIGRPVEAVSAALELVRTLDPRPGLRYNKIEPRLIEPDVAFVKHGDEFTVVLNDEDVPQLRLSPTYRRLLNRDAADKDVRGYVKERYKSAIQLIKNIEQRKQTIMKVCYAIVGRQRDFLERGIDQLKPMMIKEVAEEIGVHPSTVSRAVANKYAHTPQGVFELRYFFSESVNGPEGGGTSLLILKRRVKKLIEDEDTTHPLTDDQITRILQSQGIQVTRRTVAKYREDMGIPSTHQRRIKN